MLNSAGHEHVAYCVCDPSQDDLPIVFSSDEFCDLTGYSFKEIEGRNCRFLQGPDTAQEDVDRIRTAIREQQTVQVNLLNYRKDGTTFPNEFFLSPLRDDAHKAVYVSFLPTHCCALVLDMQQTLLILCFFSRSREQFIGVQCPVKKLGPGQAPQNNAWVYTQGNHA